MQFKFDKERGGGDAGTASKCPACGATTRSGFVLCVACGLDFRTGQRWQGKDEALRNPPPAENETTQPSRLADHGLGNEQETAGSERPKIRIKYSTPDTVTQGATPVAVQSESTHASPYAQVLAIGRNQRAINWLIGGVVVTCWCIGVIEGSLHSVLTLLLAERPAYTGPYSILRLRPKEVKASVGGAIFGGILGGIGASLVFGAAIFGGADSPMTNTAFSVLFLICIDLGGSMTEVFGLGKAAFAMVGFGALCIFGPDALNSTRRKSAQTSSASSPAASVMASPKAGVVVAASATPSGAVSGDGPFGFRAGMSKAQVITLVGERSIEPSEIANFYHLNTAPKPHPDFDHYSLVISPKAGLVRVVAMSRQIPTSSYGEVVKAEFTKIRDQVAKTYGRYEEYDYLQRGSIWKEPWEWMSALEAKERNLSCFWRRETQADLRNSVIEVILEAKNLDIKHGMVLLTYTFSGYVEYEEGQKNAF